MKATFLILRRLHVVGVQRCHIFKCQLDSFLQMLFISKIEEISSRSFYRISSDTLFTNSKCSKGFSSSSIISYNAHTPSVPLMLPKRV